MEDWTRRHLSDHCGFHHREFILSKLLVLDNISLPSVHEICASKPVGSVKPLQQIAPELLEEFSLLWRKEFYFTERLILLYL
jgi:hypothetical protein